MVLGMGSFSVVTLETCRDFEGQVAVKRLGPQTPTSLKEYCTDASLPCWLADVITARALSGLQGVPPIHDASWEAGPQPAIRMTMAPYSCTWGHLRKAPLSRHHQVLRDVTLALGRCALLGMAHRDLKPSNVLVNTQGDQEAVVTDFGTVWWAGHHPASSPTDKWLETLTAGTVIYAAPEALAAYTADYHGITRQPGDIHGRVTPTKLDPWSLGASLGDATGLAPVPAMPDPKDVDDAEAPEEVLWQVLKAASPASRDWLMCHHLPRALYRALPHMVPKKNRNRPRATATASEDGSVLKRFISDMCVAQPDKRPTMLEACTHAAVGGSLPALARDVVAHLGRRAKVEAIPPSFSAAVRATHWLAAVNWLVMNVLDQRAPSVAALTGAVWLAARALAAARPPCGDLPPFQRVCVVLVAAHAISGGTPGGLCHLESSRALSALSPVHLESYVLTFFPKLKITAAEMRAVNTATLLQAALETAAAVGFDAMCLASPWRLLTAWLARGDHPAVLRRVAVAALVACLHSRDVLARLDADVLAAAAVCVGAAVAGRDVRDVLAPLGMTECHVEVLKTADPFVEAAIEAFYSRRNSDARRAVRTFRLDGMSAFGDLFLWWWAGESQRSSRVKHAN